MKNINKNIFLSNNYDLNLDKKAIKDFPIISISKKNENYIVPIYSVGLEMYKLKYFKIKQ